MDNQQSLFGLLLSDDLLFASRILGTARGLGWTLHAVRSSEALLETARRQAPGCVIVDLANPGLRLPDLMARLREVCPRTPRVVAYGSHVDAVGLKAAREAGCDPVLPRSKFVDVLPRQLANCFAASDTSLQ